MTDEERSRAPWTPGEVASLNWYQVSGTFHPFTCPNRGDGQHFPIRGDLGGLTATTDGWVCSSCEYRQDWAHAWMADGSWRNALRRRQQLIARLRAAQTAPDAEPSSEPVEGIG